MIINIQPDAVMGTKRRTPIAAIPEKMYYIRNGVAAPGNKHCLIEACPSSCWAVCCAGLWHASRHHIGF